MFRSVLLAMVCAWLLVGFTRAAEWTSPPPYRAPEFGRARVTENGSLEVAWAEWQLRVRTVNRSLPDGEWKTEEVPYETPEPFSVRRCGPGEFVVFVGDEVLTEAAMAEILGGGDATQPFRIGPDRVGGVAVLIYTGFRTEKNPLDAHYRGLFAKDIPVINIAPVTPAEWADVPGFSGFPGVERPATPVRPVDRSEDRPMTVQPASPVAHAQPTEAGGIELTYHVCWISHEILERRIVVDGEPTVARGSVAKLAYDTWAVQAGPDDFRLLLANREPVAPEDVRAILAGKRPVVFCPVDQFLDSFYVNYFAPNAPVAYLRPAKYQAKGEDWDLRYEVNASVAECPFSIGKNPWGRLVLCPD